MAVRETVTADSGRQRHYTPGVSGLKAPEPADHGGDPYQIALDTTAGGSSGNGPGMPPVEYGIRTKFSAGEGNPVAGGGLKPALDIGKATNAAYPNTDTRVWGRTK